MSVDKAITNLVLSKSGLNCYKENTTHEENLSKENTFKKKSSLNYKMLKPCPVIVHHQDTIIKLLRL